MDDDSSSPANNNDTSTPTDSDPYALVNQELSDFSLQILPLQVISGSISVAFAIITLAILLFMFVKKAVEFSKLRFKVAILRAMNDILYGVVNIVIIQNYNANCQAGMTFYVFGRVLSAFLNCIFAIQLHLSFLKNNVSRITGMDQEWKPFILVPFAVATVCALIPLAAGQFNYSDDYGYCWFLNVGSNINSEQYAQYMGWQWGTLYGPICIGMIYNLYVVIACFMKIRAMESSSSGLFSRKNSKKSASQTLASMDKKETTTNGSMNNITQVALAQARSGGSINHLNQQQDSSTAKFAKSIPVAKNSISQQKSQNKWQIEFLRSSLAFALIPVFCHWGSFCTDLQVDLTSMEIFALWDLIIAPLQGFLNFLVLITSDIVFRTTTTKLLSCQSDI